jgi:hypothetical protein
MRGIRRARDDRSRTIDVCFFSPGGFGEYEMTVLILALKKEDSRSKVKADDADESESSGVGELRSLKVDVK